MALLAAPMPTHDCQLPVRPPGAYVIATILPPSSIMRHTSRTATRNAFAWEFRAVSHWSNVMFIGPW